MGTQKHNEVVKMDARKFVRFINNSALSKITFLESAIKKMGAENDKSWKFVAIDGNTLMFEDIDTNVYYTANVAKDGNAFTIDKISRVSVVEEEKSDLFNENCKALVDSICEGKMGDADKAYKKLESQRFRSRIIPEHGYVTTKDGITRKVTTSKTHLKESVIPIIVKALSEQLKNSVELAEGRVVKAIFRDNSEFKLPINEYTRRQAIAKNIKESAEKAYSSDSFCKFIKSISTLVSEGKINDSVKIASKFLKEEQEFTVLTLPEVVVLVENALASCGVFSSDLAFKTATLLHKTNLKVNKGEIVESWSNAAKIANSAALLENTQILSASNDFEKDHAEFMRHIFCESSSITKAKADLYKLGLTSALKHFEHAEGNEDVVDSLRGIIQDLEKPEVDDAAVDDALKIWMGLDQELIDDLTSLDDFDEIPGDESEGEDEDSDNGEIIPLPETPEDNVVEAPPMAAPPAARPGVTPPLMADKDQKGNVLAEDVVLIENMNDQQLLDELRAWKINGNIWLKEDGFDDCFSQMSRYITRCEDINSALKKEFDVIRSAMLEDNLNISLDEAHDPYAKSLEESFKFADSPQSTDIRMDELQTGKTVVPKEVGKTDGRKGEKSNSGAVEGNPRMDELQTGKTVVGREVGKSDGRKGDKSNSGAVEGNPRMDELQTGKTVVPKKIGKTDGRSAGSTAVEEEVGGWFTKDPNGSKTATSMRDSSVGKGKTVVTDTPHKMKDASDLASHAASNAPEKLGKPSELQGNASVVGKGFKTTGGAKGDKAASGAAKLPPGGLSMRDPDVGKGDSIVKDTPDKLDGEFGGNLASESMDPIDRIAAILEAEAVDKPFSNGTKPWDKKKDAANKSAAPSANGKTPAVKKTDCGKCGIGKDCACTTDECHRPNQATKKNSKSRVSGAGVRAPAVSEDVSIDITTPKGTNVRLSSTDERIDDVIRHVLDAMEGSGDSDVLGGELGSTDTMSGDIGGDVGDSDGDIGGDIGDSDGDIGDIANDVNLDTVPGSDAISEPIEGTGEAELSPEPVGEVDTITGTDMDFGDGEGEGLADSESADSEGDKPAEDKPFEGDEETSESDESDESDSDDESESEESDESESEESESDDKSDKKSKKSSKKDDE